MQLFWKREKAVRARLAEYFAATDAAVAELDKAIACYFEQGPGDAFRKADRQVHAAESKADDIRVDIENMLYRSMLLPESRGDILGLLESFDAMPNLTEKITSTIWTERITALARWREPFERMLALNIEAYRLVRGGVDALLQDPDRVEAALAPVDARESASDKIELELIHEIFGSDLDRVDMVLLRDLIHLVGDISDAAERVARRLLIVSLKRRV